jgi:uncharacterized coiled-coil protein SlyX
MEILRKCIIEYLDALKNTAIHAASENDLNQIADQIFGADNQKLINILKQKLAEEKKRIEKMQKHYDDLDLKIKDLKGDKK